MAKNQLANKATYALQQMNVIDLVADGYTSITSNSDSVPTTVNYAYMTPSFKIIADIEFGQDADQVDITLPYDVRIIGGNVHCVAANANGGVIIQKDSAEMCSEIACITNEALTAITNLSSLEALVVSDSDTINIVGVSSSTDGVVTLDFLPV